MEIKLVKKKQKSGITVFIVTKLFKKNIIWWVRMNTFILAATALAPQN